MLMVSPSAPSTIRETRMERGMDTAMMRVLRQLPRKTRIMTTGETAGNDALAHHAADGAAHKDRLIR